MSPSELSEDMRGSCFLRGRLNLSPNEPEHRWFYALFKKVNPSETSSSSSRLIGHCVVSEKKFNGTIDLSSKQI